MPAGNNDPIASAKVPRLAGNGLLSERGSAATLCVSADEDGPVICLDLVAAGRAHRRFERVVQKLERRSKKPLVVLAAFCDDRLAWVEVTEYGWALAEDFGCRDQLDAHWEAVLR
jgi:hypothetical protein